MRRIHPAKKRKKKSSISIQMIVVLFVLVVNFVGGYEWHALFYLSRL